MLLCAGGEGKSSTTEKGEENTREMELSRFSFSG
jgi:hypothetical protein